MANEFTDTNVTGALDVTGTVTVGTDVEVTGDLDVDGGTVMVGVADTTRGVLTLEGGSVFSGGFLRLESAADYSSTPGLFDFVVSGANLLIKAGTTESARVESDGTFNIRGGLDVGASGSTQGQAVIYHGSGGNTPGYIQMYSANGTDIYLHVAADGTLRYGTSAPTSDTSGTAVAAPVDASGQLKLDDATGLTETISTLDTWQPMTQFESSISNADGTNVTATVGADDYLEIGTDGGGEYVITAEISAEPVGNNQDIWIGFGIDGADPAEGNRAKRTLSNGSFGYWGVRSRVALTATDKLRMEIKNATSTNNVAVQMATLLIQRVG